MASRAEGVTLEKAAFVIEEAAWSGLNFLNFTKPHFEHYRWLLKHYAEYQLVLVDAEQKYAVAAGNCVPLYCEDPDQLSNEGWDWAVRTAAETIDREPNMLVGLAISVSRSHQRKGLARVLINRMKELAADRGMKSASFPVRPSAKHLYPDVPISDYAHWKNDAGAPFDPWLRSHAMMGGRIIKPCERSMVVEEPIGFWENMTGENFRESGSFHLKGGLVPLEIDLENDLGTYVEPNVWMTYAS